MIYSTRLLANCFPDYFPTTIKQERVCRLKIDPLTTETCKMIVDEYNDKLSGLHTKHAAASRVTGHRGLATHIVYKAYNEFLQDNSLTVNEEFVVPNEVQNKLSFIDEADRAFWAFTAIQPEGFLLPHYDDKRVNLAKVTIAFPVIIDTSEDFSPIEIYTDQKIYCTDKRKPCAVNITKLHGVFNMTQNLRYNIHLRIKIPYTEFAQKYSNYIEW